MSRSSKNSSLRVGSGNQVRSGSKWAPSLALPLAILLVAGCSIGPRFKRPLVNLQPYHNAPTIESRTSTLPAPSLDSWWTGFADPELTKIIQRALSENLDLAASLERAMQVRAAAQEAGAGRTSNLDLEGSSTSSRQSIETPIGRAVSTVFPNFHRSQNDLNLGIGATWEANAGAQAAEAARLGTRVSIAAESADAYLQIRGAQVRLTFAKEQIETDEHLQQLVLQRKRAGVASDRELAQAEALLSQAKAISQINIILEAQLNRLDALSSCGSHTPSRDNFGRQSGANSES